jgi:dolichol-phosphate mannosyltransferase
LKIFEAIEFVAHEVWTKTLIIVPTYNERENIGILLTQITRIVPGAYVLVVDDQSPDGTGRVVEAFRRKHPGANVTLMSRDGERGLGNAYRAGLQYGLENGYEVLVTMDSDLSHSPLYLPAILEALKDSDLVIGSRYIRDGGTINWRIRRILLSWMANRFARFLLGLKGADLTSGYRAYRRELLESIGLEHIQSNGYSYLVEMLYRAQQKKARATEVPILFYDRTLGKSKISKREIYKGAFTLLRLRLNKKK